LQLPPNSDIIREKKKELKMAVLPDETRSQETYVAYES